MNISNSKEKEIKEVKLFEVTSAVEEAIQEVLKDKQDNPEIIIPYCFLEFYNRQEMLDLISSVFNYSQTLLSINSHYLKLKKEGKLHEAERFSQKQSFLLPDLGRSVAKKYGQLILKQKSIVSSIDDQYFFETIIFFTIKVVKTGFSNEEFAILDDELNRLFRSTAFNIAQRKNLESEKLKKFPHLRQTPKRDADSIINGIIMRNWYSKSEQKNYSLDSISRPAYSKISPYKAISSRSPLISLLLPSPKDKIREFELFRRRVISNHHKLPQIHDTLK